MPGTELDARDKFFSKFSSPDSSSFSDEQFQFVLNPTMGKYKEL